MREIYFGVDTNEICQFRPVDVNLSQLLLSSLRCKFIIVPSRIALRALF